jgi:hypothetical protein
MSDPEMRPAIVPKKSHISLLQLGMNSKETHRSQEMRNLNEADEFIKYAIRHGRGFHWKLRSIWKSLTKSLEAYYGAGRFPAMRMIYPLRSPADLFAQSASSEQADRFMCLTILAPLRPNLLNHLIVTLKRATRSKAAVTRLRGQIKGE